MPTGRPASASATTSGAPADATDCAQVAIWIRDLLATLKLKCWVKSSGSKGLQLHIPLNTPASYSIYIAGLVFQWLKKLGGLQKIAQMNHAKAQVLYDFLDQTEFYYSPVEKEDRSLMNVPFKLRNEALNDDFLKGAKQRGMVELKNVVDIRLF